MGRRFSTGSQAEKASFSAPVTHSWLPAGKLLADCDDVIRALGVGKTKLFELVRDRRIQPTYIDGSLRFHPDDVEAFVKELRSDQAA